MKISEKFQKKVRDLKGEAPITIAFLGDSVTHGVFEVYPVAEGNLPVSYDAKSVYHTYLKEMLNHVFPSVPVNIINAGINGGTASEGVLRLERDVLRFSPDLTVVAFGLNDCGKGETGILMYQASLREIFKKLQASGSEVIFMTENMLNTSISIHITDQRIKEMARCFMNLQKSGVLDAYMEAAKEVCEEYGIPVCDCYTKWKKLDALGADITELLSNHLNHPTREMHHLFADSLFEIMFFE